MYGKIEDGAVTLWESGSKDGFYPIVLAESPKENPPDGYRYETYWEQGENEIRQVWRLDEVEIDEAEAYDIIFGGGGE